MTDWKHRFQGGGFGLLLLETDLREPERFILDFAGEAARRMPSAFQGDTPAVFFRVRYVPPYEQFQELRRLILAVRAHTGLNSAFCGVVGLDLSEWRGHENEEYLTIVLKYLADCGRKWLILAPCCGYREDELARLQRACLPYLSARRERMMVFEIEGLTQRLTDFFLERAVLLDASGARLLATALCDQRLADYRSIHLIERTAEDVMESYANLREKKGRITRKGIEAYLADEQCGLCMLAGCKLIEGDRNEQSLSL